MASVEPTPPLAFRCRILCYSTRDYNNSSLRSHLELPVVFWPVKIESPVLLYYSGSHEFCERQVVIVSPTFIVDGKRVRDVI